MLFHLDTKSLQVDDPLLLLHFALQDPLVQGGVSDNSDSSLLLAATEGEVEHFSGNTKAKNSVKISPLEERTITFPLSETSVYEASSDQTVMLHHILFHSDLINK